MLRSGNLRLRCFFLAGAAGLACLIAPTVAAHAHHADFTVFVSALDFKGIPLTDLEKDDWGVREDGANRPLVDARRATEKLNVVLLVDSTKLTQPYLDDIRKACLTLVKTLRAGDPNAAVSLMTFGGAATTLVDFGKPAGDLDKALQRLFPNQETTGVMFEALIAASKQLSKSEAPRRAIVMLNLENEGEGSANTVTPQTVANAVLPSHASLWVISFHNISAGERASGSEPNRDLLLSNLPTQTGGIRNVVNTTNVLEGNLKRIAEVLLAQYAVTYSRPEGAAPKLLQMAVARPGAQMLVPRTPPN